MASAPKSGASKAEPQAGLLAVGQAIGQGKIGADSSPIDIAADDAAIAKVIDKAKEEADLMAALEAEEAAAKDKANADEAEAKAKAAADEATARELACAKCEHEMHGDRKVVKQPCLEHFMAAGYKAEDYEKWFPPTSDAPATRVCRITKPGHTLCKITGTNVIYMNRLVPVDTVDEFLDEIVLDMPTVFVPVE